MKFLKKMPMEIISFGTHREILSGTHGEIPNEVFGEILNRTPG